MGNKLGKNLEGKHIVVSTEYLGGSEAQRVFLARSGFGCRPLTMGSAVIGEFIATGEDTRIEGYMVEKFATKKLIAAAKKLRKEFDEKKPTFTAEDIKIDKNGNPYVIVNVPVHVAVHTRPETKQSMLALGGTAGLIRGTQVDGNYTHMVIRAAFRHWLENVEPQRMTQEDKENQKMSVNKLDLKHVFSLMRNWLLFTLLASVNIDEHPILITVPDEMYEQITKKEG